MDAEVFDMIAWNDAEAALKGTNQMFNMLYAKRQASAGWDTAQASGKIMGTPNVQAAGG